MSRSAKLSRREVRAFKSLTARCPRCGAALGRPETAPVGCARCLPIMREECWLIAWEPEPGAPPIDFGVEVPQGDAPMSEAERAAFIAQHHITPEDFEDICRRCAPPSPLDREATP